MKYAWIARQRSTHSIRTMCRALGVSSSGWYAWRTRKPSARARENERLAVAIKDLHYAFREAYGTERLWRELRDRGYAGGYTAVKRTVREIRPNFRSFNLNMPDYQ